MKKVKKTPTPQEIEKVIQAGEQFIKEHPTSMFGGDNIHDFNIFKKVIEMFRKGRSLDAIEDIVNDAYELEDSNTALDIIEWLRGNGDSPY